MMPSLRIIAALGQRKSKRGLIEYLPIEIAPEPVKGEKSLFINCIWVLPRFKKKGIGKALSLIGLLVSPVTAEVTEYRLGHLLEGVFDVVGFNFLDLTSAIPTLFIFGFFIAMLVSIKWLISRF